MSFTNGVIGLAKPGPVLTTKALGENGSARHLGIIREKLNRLCGFGNTGEIHQENQEEIH